METGMGRRVFVGSVMAALPLVASTRGKIFAQSSDAAHVHADTAIADPVLEHINRQLATQYNAMRRDPRGEHVRAFAAQLRTLTVYGRQNGLDDSIRSGIAGLVAKEGRYNVLYLEPDRERMRSELRAVGVQPDERLLTTAVSLDHKSREATLDSLLRSGLSERWERVATLFERLAPEVDRRSSGVVRVSRQDAAYWEGYCTQLWSEFSEVMFLTGVICAAALIPIIGIAIAPFCFAHQLAAMMLGFVYAVYCWNVL